MKDILLAIVFVLILIPIFHFTTNVAPNVFTTGFFVLIMIPTLITLINGAPFVPTPMSACRKMMKLAKIKPGETVYDIGCGDGRMVYLAANEHQAKATGFELSPLVYTLAFFRKLFWRSKAKIRFRNFKNQDFRQADVIVCYLMPETLVLLRDKMEKELKPGSRVISYAFQIAGWKEAYREEKDPAQSISQIWVYQR
ncbi:MAG TPA: class I SAM-dependent methyltransferase [Candidatus Gracilibacteria bacterium]|nr:class I SAM-dependent methyltransferase [Candidatus Gracilibacteria bacterium]